MAARDDKIVALTSSLTALDEQKDSLQNALDAWEEGNSMEEEGRNKAHRDVADLRMRLQVMYNVPECNIRESHILIYYIHQFYLPHLGV